VLMCRFGGRQISATEHDGVTNYASIRESAEEEQARLERFARELEAS
jgi:HIV Tat-specific factor 1